MSRHGAAEPAPSGRERDEWKDVTRKPRRVKVVLADRAGSRRLVRNAAPTIEPNSAGETLVRELVRSQLRMALGLAAVAVVLLAGLPAFFQLMPEVANGTVFGVRVPWLLLGFVAYPVLVGVGLLHNRLAERNERDFVDMLDR
ncbi:hypothetical protein GCM10012275_53830 [Longimycelium tulufanense]|uniref:Uncharacterized protein n=1 Tax=Longimycelium tulufanense TaxID=907463 RepID=A0A8J3FZ04_9PSEU|nr:hypothetical protein [Longimycelium tulufanense]GGM76298.1 hypothetical protein GCM10012275_53830 [Longimycelium tulufanense]